MVSIIENTCEVDKRVPKQRPIFGKQKGVSLFSPLWEETLGPLAQI